MPNAFTYSNSEHTCGFCGICLIGLKRRFQCPKEIQAFAARRCKPTQFLYSFIVHASNNNNGTPLPTRQALCIPCVNWKRRVGTGEGLKRTKQPMLQIDQLILYLMQPGKHQEPDHRCMERLVMAVRQGTNPFIGVLPVPVQTIISLVKDNTYRDCVLAWWEYNGRTRFFASAPEARRVRCAVKCADPAD